MNRATKKMLSAIFSSEAENLSLSERIDKKENKLAVIKKTHAIPVNSSIVVISFIFVILREVKTIKQNPNKLDDVFKICCEFDFFI